MQGGSWEHRKWVTWAENPVGAQISGVPVEQLHSSWYTLIHGVTLYLLYVDIGYMFVCIIYWVYYILLDIDTHCCWIYRFCDRPLGGQITQRASQLQSMGRNLAKRIPSDCSECPIANCRREYSRCSTGIFPYNASAPCRSHAEHIC